MTTNWDKLQEALNGLHRRAPSGFTAWEFAEARGCSAPKARQEIGLLIRDGKLKFAGNRSVIRIDGRRGVNPVYSEVAPQKRARVKST